MKKILATALLSSVLFAGDLFVGVNYIGGSGTVSLSTDNGSYTFTDSDSISTKGMKIYIGSGKIYGFYETGTITTDTQYMGDQDYTAYGIGYLYQGKPSSIGLKALVDLYAGYDVMTSNKDGIYDEDKSGILLGLTVGGAYNIVDNLDLTAAIGYELHAVKDDGDTSDNTWNFASLIYSVGVKYSF